jgi:hypothetical protein
LRSRSDYLVPPDKSISDGVHLVPKNALQLCQIDRSVATFVRMSALAVVLGGPA